MPEKGVNSNIKCSVFRISTVLICSLEKCMDIAWCLVLFHLLASVIYTNSLKSCMNEVAKNIFIAFLEPHFLFRDLFLLLGKYF